MHYYKHYLATALSNAPGHRIIGLFSVTVVEQAVYYYSDMQQKFDQPLQLKFLVTPLDTSIDTMNIRCLADQKKV